MNDQQFVAICERYAEAVNRALPSLLAYVPEHKGGPVSFRLVSRMHTFEVQALPSDFPDERSVRGWLGLLIGEQVRAIVDDEAEGARAE